MRRAALLAARGIHFVDCGTSGGVWGLEDGYSLMVGGDEAAVERLRPIFETLAPAPDRGWGHVGPERAPGHFVKMIHNGIEYGLMQAYAEGFAILHAQARVRARPAPDRRDLAARQRGALVAARPDRGARWPRIPHLDGHRAATSPTPAKGAGPWPRRSTSTCRRR